MLTRRMMVAGLLATPGLAAAIFARIDAAQEQAERVLQYGPSDLVPWSPVTEKHVADGMSIAALCAAALQESDNTAANLLLGTIGGPPGWTAFARRLGDRASRLDRIEPALNSALSGDPRDTTTPAAMLENLRKVLLGDVLKAPSRQRLIDTMAASTTGARQLKAGLPADWRVAGKTGSGENGTRNDIGILLPPERAPILACVYFTGSTLPDAGKDAVLAAAGRIIPGI